jgi:hypothetical protein
MLRETPPSPRKGRGGKRSEQQVGCLRQVVHPAHHDLQILPGDEGAVGVEVDVQRIGVLREDRLDAAPGEGAIDQGACGDDSPQ